MSGLSWLDVPPIPDRESRRIEWPWDHWDLEPPPALPDPRALVGALLDIANEPTKRGRVAFEALCGALEWWCGSLYDSDQRPARAEIAAWLETFSLCALARDVEIVSAIRAGGSNEQSRDACFIASMLATVPSEPVTSMVDWSLAMLGFHAEHDSSDSDWTRRWWALRGGSIGAGARLVHALTTAVEVPRAQGVLQPPHPGLSRRAVRIRDGLVGSIEALRASGQLSLAARAWCAEHLAVADPTMFVEILAAIGEPLLAERLREFGVRRS